jgi:large conductance mechanosensitive channel
MQKQAYGMLNEFREFILKGSAFDLAIAVIIGAAFSTVVASLVSDILLPPLGFIIGGLDFSSYFLDLTALAKRALGQTPQVFGSVVEAQKAGHAVIGFGKFLNAVINLVITGFAIFVLVKQINRWRKPGAAEPSAEVRLLTEIRDLLKTGRE